MALPTREELVASVRDVCRGPATLTLVEGAGGLLVELGADGATLRDVALDLAAPVLVVVAPGLGTLNHTALTLEALATQGISCAGLVIGAYPADPGTVEDGATSTRWQRWLRCAPCCPPVRLDECRRLRDDSARPRSTRRG